MTTAPALPGLVVIGGSYAGMQTALAARENGYGRPITLLTDEDHLAYQRPPLSKAFLLGDDAPASLVIRDGRFFETNAIGVRTGAIATRIDRESRRVIISDGSAVPFETLAICTGSRARRLSVPGANLPGVHTLRSLSDAVALRARLRTARDVVIVGGGFIGLEVAASARVLGKNVTIVEAAGRLLERAVTPLIARTLLRMHERQGVEVRFGETVREIVGGNDTIRAVVLASGARLCADLVVVGIGGLPNDDLARDAGLVCTNGIVVDEYGRTSDPTIFAAGDCANHRNGFAGEWIRLESVQNAQDQARCAGTTIAGTPLRYDNVPWFWSDQYDTKLQMVGFSRSHDRAVVRGTVEDERFSVFYYRSERLIAVDSVNAPGDQVIAKRFLSTGFAPSPDEAADPSFDLKAFLKRTTTPSRAAV